MKKMILFSIISLSASLVHAQEKPIYSLVVTDPQIGSLQLKVEEVLEPTYANLRMTVSKKCFHDPSGNKSAKWVVISTDSNGNSAYPKQVCYFNPDWNSKSEAWDTVNKELSIRYTEISERPGPADCSVFNVDTISLRAACPR